MTDKEKILSEIATRKLCTMDEHMAFYNDTAKEDYRLLSEIEELIKALQEEPVSEFMNTESMIESYKQRLISQTNGVKDSPLIDMCLASYKHGINDTLDTLNLSNVQRTVKNWKEPVSEDLEQAAVEAFKQIVDSDKNNFLEIFKAGAEWQKQHLWKPANGDDLPEIDREVIVLIQDYPNDKDHLRVAFAHRPNKYTKVWNSDLGEEQVVEIDRYDKGGWNIPNVVYWLDVKLPKEIEL